MRAPRFGPWTMWLGAVLCILVIGVLSLPRRPPARDLTLPTAPVSASYFGLHIHRAVPTARFPTACAWPDIGFYGWRLWDAGVAWPMLEPAPGEWSFGTLDSCVALADRERVEILLPLGLSPTWASARPEEPSAYGPGFAAEPKDMDSWRTYVRTVASRYRGRVRHYEIWNEPNLTPFFSGTPETMVALAREAHAILKEVDPLNVVVSPSPTHGDSGVAWLDTYLSRGGGTLCDVIGFHCYTSGKRPETIRLLALGVREVLARHALSTKPIWNTETGWDIPAMGAESSTQTIQAQAEAAGLVARALISGWAGGLARFYWYSWDNFTMGLTEQDGRTEKPAALAFRATRRWILGKRMKDWCHSSSDVYSVTLVQPDGRESWLVWTGRGKRDYAIPETWRVTQVEDFTGARRPAADVITISDCPVLLAGFNP